MSAEAEEGATKPGQLNGAKSAAVLLMAMGEENAANVLQHMRPEDVQLVSAAMVEIDAVSQQQIASTLDQFVSKVERDSSIGAAPDKYLQSTLMRALGHDQAIGVLSEANSATLSPTLDVLKWMPNRVVAGMIADEHPQFIAIVLSYLDSEKAGQIVDFLPEALQSDLLIRVSQLDFIHPTALREIDSILDARFGERFEIELKAAGGEKAVAAILNGVSPEQEEQIMEKLTAFDADLAERIRDNMFVFENLLKVDDRGIQSLLREVPGDLLVKALKGTSTEVQNKLFSNMSRRAAVLLKDDLAASGPARLADVEEAQKEVLGIAFQLAEDGKIQLGGKGDDFV